MTEADPYTFHASNNPFRIYHVENNVRDALGVPPRLTISLTNGHIKAKVFPYLNIHTSHQGHTKSSPPDNQVDALLMSLLGEIDIEKLKSEGERGEQEYNQLIGTTNFGPYYPHEGSSLCYTAGAAVAKLIRALDILPENVGLHKHDLVATDWHISHGQSNTPSVIENKPHQEVDALLDRLLTAQRDEETFFSSFAVAHRFADGRVGVAETRVNIGKLNPDMPFDEIAQYVFDNRDILPAGMDLLTAKARKMLVNRRGDTHSAYRRWYLQGGAKPHVWRDYILPYDLARAKQDMQYIPQGEALITSDQYKDIYLGGLGDEQAKALLFGDFD